jgi:hypothetical protein
MSRNPIAVWMPLRSAMRPLVVEYDDAKPEVEREHRQHAHESDEPAGASTQLSNLLVG